MAEVPPGGPDGDAMISPLIVTKLYIPRTRTNAVPRGRLTSMLNDGAHRRLTLIAAPAGYGKTTLVAAWLQDCGRPAAWLSLDEEDNDLVRFLSYLIAALRTLDESLGSDALRLLHSPRPPHVDATMTALINDLANVRDPFVLVLDDYHEIRTGGVHEAISFLLERMPPKMHAVLLAREEPALRLARMRVRDEVSDLSVADLRFRPEETAAFLRDTMSLELTPDALSALDRRAEGWIAGLQIAALSVRSREDIDRIVYAGEGDQRLLVDYLFEDVLRKQPEAVRLFLLYTSILDRLCGPLCDALLLREASAPGEETLSALERANLFLIPLDPDRRWYRYHRLFASALRRKLQRLPAEPGKPDAAEIHARASGWFERNGYAAEAFRHAAASNRTELAARLAEGGGYPLHLRGESAAVLQWLESLPVAELDARPSLWVIYGSSLLLAGRATEIEPRLRAAESAMQGSEEDASLRNWIGLIAATRAAVAAIAISGRSQLGELRLRDAEEALRGTEEDDKTNAIVGRIVSARSSAPPPPEPLDAVIEQGRLALTYLLPELVPVRMTMVWLIGFASHLRGNRAEAREAYSEVLSMSRATAGNMLGSMATVGLGGLFEKENRLQEAEACYRSAVRTMGDLPLQAVSEAYLGIARIQYAWNDVEQAKHSARRSIRSALEARNDESVVTGELFLAEVSLAGGDWDGASELLAEAERSARTRLLSHRFGDIDRVRALVAERKEAARRRANGDLDDSFVEPLTERELEVLRLIAHGLSNREIGDRLFLALDTVKGHNRRIFDKLRVQRRTEAVALARRLRWIE